MVTFDLSVYQLLWFIVLVNVSLSIAVNNLYNLLTACLLSIIIMYAPIYPEWHSMASQIYAETSLITIVSMMIISFLLIGVLATQYDKLFQWGFIPLMYGFVCIAFPDISVVKDQSAWSIIHVILSNLMHGQLTLGFILLLAAIILWIVSWNYRQDYYYPFVFLLIALIFSDLKIAEKIITLPF